MSWTQCEKGHSYNSLDNPKGCPHCGDLVKAAPKPTIIHNPPPTFVAQGENAEQKTKAIQNKTVAVLRKNSEELNDSFDPVVAWFVCTKGKDVGKDFKVLSGWNGIGRDLSMSICIPSDESISREDHAKVLYDIQTHKFYLAPGSGRNAIYLNGSALLQATDLNTYDVVDLGNTQLSFIAFCGDKFNW